MKLAGEHRFAVPRETLWKALLDPALLANVLPGCEPLEATGRRHGKEKAPVERSKSVHDPRSTGISSRSTRMLDTAVPRCMTLIVPPRARAVTPEPDRHGGSQRDRRRARADRESPSQRAAMKRRSESEPRTSRRRNA